LEPASADEVARDDNDANQRTRRRSQVPFPYVDLNQAIEIVDAAYNHAEDVTRVAASLGTSVTSSTFQMKISAARLFGLIEKNGKQLIPTELGHQILDDAQERRARVRAFLNVPLYAMVYKKYEGRRLPHDQGLEGFMASQGVSPKQTGKARQSFQRSATQAGFFDMSKDMLVVPADTPVAAQPEPTPEEPMQEVVEAPRRSSATSGSIYLGSKGRLLDGLFEALPLPGEDWAEEGQDGYQQWLETAKAIFKLIYKEPRARSEA
jgi:hypothetical protein